MIDRNKYIVTTTNDQLWDIPNLVEFLNTHQGDDIVLNVNPEAHSLHACGLYDIVDKFKFRSVTIATWNLLEHHPTYTIRQKPPRLWFFDPKQWAHWGVTAEQQQWNKSKIFGTFYGRPTADRLGIASHLFTHYREASELVLAFDPTGIDDRALFELTKLYDYHREGIVAFTNLEPHLPMSKEGVDYENCIYRRTNPGMFDLYQNILVDIVSEPNILGDTFFLTEKVVRCLLLKKPFILMGGRENCTYFRRMGFKTFNEFWPEDYDSFEGKNRYLQILSLIDDLAKRTDLEQLYEKMQPTLEHNYKMLTEQTFTKDVV